MSSPNVLWMSINENIGNVHAIFAVVSVNEEHLYDGYSK
jgi:hypothetical protein